MHTALVHPISGLLFPPPIRVVCMYFQKCRQLSAKDIVLYVFVLQVAHKYIFRPIPRVSHDEAGGWFHWVCFAGVG